MAARRKVEKWKKGVRAWPDGNTINLSVVFTWDLEDALRKARSWRKMGYDVRVGGPGVHVATSLRAEIAKIAEIGGSVSEAVTRHNPDATFASRGCPVGCWFCIVPSMEGRTFTEIDNFVPRPILCDNNLSALSVKFQEHIVKRYRDADVPLMDANSGFEPRTFDLGVYERWKDVNRGPWRFACDDADDAPFVWKVLEMLKDRVPNRRRKRVYVLIGNEPFDACMERIRKTLELGGEPHVQPLMKLNALKKEPWVQHDWTADRLRHVARWTNRWLYKYTDFENYDPSIRTNSPRSRKIFTAKNRKIYSGLIVP